MRFKKFTEEIAPFYTTRFISVPSGLSTGITEKPRRDKNSRISVPQNLSPCSKAKQTSSKKRRTVKTVSHSLPWVPPTKRTEPAVFPTVSTGIFLPSTLFPMKKLFEHRCSLVIAFIYFSRFAEVGGKLNSKKIPPAYSILLKYMLKL